LIKRKGILHLCVFKKKHRQIMDQTNSNMSLIKYPTRFSLSLFIFFLSLTISFSSLAQQAAPQGTPGSAANTTGAAVPAPAGADPALISAGESLFKNNCSSCHAPHEQVVGPALSGVSKRRPIDWIIKFVHNSQKVIKEEKDPYAVALFTKFNNTVMTSFPSFSDQEIKSIVAYIESVPVPDKTPSGGTASSAQTAQSGGGNNTLLYGLIIIVLVLLIIVLILILTVVKRYLKDKETALAAEDREIVNQTFSLSTVVKSSYFISIVSIIFISIAVRSCWVGLMGIGIEQNYAPKQPIPFSHKLHAGQYKIDCNYCHTGVTKGKQANIPSLNICMNCHSQIKKGPSGEAALKNLRDHYESGTPVKWIRVHNLPDLAYFNHSQHVKVGGIECRTCHGDIDSMDVVRQHSPLTMGWCINCHRTTAVNGKDNAYYDKLIKLHNSKSKGDMTVAQIGGLECSKCHY
jgi:mono/diheme cytochrome c family protein